MFNVKKITLTWIDWIQNLRRFIPQSLIDRIPFTYNKTLLEKSLQFYFLEINQRQNLYLIILC